MPGSYRGERSGSHMGKDVLQKGSISCRSPRDWRAGLVSKTRPINRNGSVVGREPFLKRSHFSPSGDRTQGRKQKDDRSYSEAVISNLNLLSLPTPNDATRLRFHAAFLMLPASYPSSGIVLVAMLGLFPLVKQTNFTRRYRVRN